MHIIKRLKVLLITIGVVALLPLFIAIKLSTHYSWSSEIIATVFAAPFSGPYAMHMFLPESHAATLLEASLVALVLLALIASHPITQKAWSIPLTVIGSLAWVFMGVMGVYDGV